MSESEYDYDSYTKSLEKVLESCSKDYWTQYVEIDRQQVFVSKTYLWVSAALLGTYVAGYKYSRSLTIDLPAYVLVLFFITCLFAVFAFGICLYAIPPRRGYKRVPEKSWGEFSCIANGILKDKTPNLYATFLTEFIHKYDVAQEYSLQTNIKRVKLLRLTSWLLISSFTLALISIVTFSLIGNDIFRIWRK